MTDVVGEIIITLASQEKHYSYGRLSVSFDSTDEEILDAVQPVVLEETGINILEDRSEGNYTIKRVEESKNLYIFPKSVAGIL